MRHLALKKKESRLVWEVLLRGVVATDRMKKRGAEEEAAYQKLRSRLIAAWRGGIILGGIRPKKTIDKVMPPELMRETELAVFKKASKRDRAAVSQKITAPQKKPAA